MHAHEKINYVEFPSRNLPATQQFFKQVFGWTFEDYGPGYCAFTGQGLDGGFYASDMAASRPGSPNVSSTSAVSLLGVNSSSDTRKPAPAATSSAALRACSPLP